MSRLFRIKIEGISRDVLCREDQSVLEALRPVEELKPIQGCYGGGCGACKAQILEGDYQIFKKMSRQHVTLEEEEESYALTCCIKPLSDLTLLIVKKWR